MNRLSDKKRILIISLVVFLSVIVYIVLKLESKDEIVIENDTKSTSEIISEKSINEESDIETDKKVQTEVLTPIVVYICGRVKNPGIVHLNEGQRIYDAIEKSNGVLEDADLDTINLASKVSDGQKIYIPKIGEKVEEITSSNYPNTSSNGNELININTANSSQLEDIPGVGPSTANKIIEYREQNGKYKNIESIKDVSGIGDKKFESIKKHITT